MCVGVGTDTYGDGALGLKLKIRQYPVGKMLPLSCVRVCASGGYVRACVCVCESVIVCKSHE